MQPLWRFVPAAFFQAISVLAFLGLQHRVVFFQCKTYSRFQPFWVFKTVLCFARWTCAEEFSWDQTSPRMGFWLHPCVSKLFLIHFTFNISPFDHDFRVNVFQPFNFSWNRKTFSVFFFTSFVADCIFFWHSLRL